METLSQPRPVLVVEDEYLLLADLEQALAAAGFATEAVSSGEDALNLFLGGDHSFTALITDVRLREGGLSGWGVARRMREKQPDLPVIYVTAARGEEWASYGVPRSILITKPFAAAQLVTALSNLLNVGRSGSP